MMIGRRLKPALHGLLDRNAAVVLIGPRQVGKTTLAREVAGERDAVYVDLELPSDLAKISDVEQYCAENADRLVILDEVHRAPGLFAPCAASSTGAGWPGSGRGCSRCLARRRSSS